VKTLSGLAQATRRAHRRGALAGALSPLSVVHEQQRRNSGPRRFANVLRTKVREALGDNGLFIGRSAPLSEALESVLGKALEEQCGEIFSMNPAGEPEGIAQVLFNTDDPYREAQRPLSEQRRQILLRMATAKDEFRACQRVAKQRPTSTTRARTAKASQVAASTPFIFFSSQCDRHCAAVVPTPVVRQCVAQIRKNISRNATVIVPLSYPPLSSVCCANSQIGWRSAYIAQS
jgi:hypothetical protein